MWNKILIKINHKIKQIEIWPAERYNIISSNVICKIEIETSKKYPLYKTFYWIFEDGMYRSGNVYGFHEWKTKQDNSKFCKKLEFLKPMRYAIGNQAQPQCPSGQLSRDKYKRYFLSG